MKGPFCKQKINTEFIRHLALVSRSYSGLLARSGGRTKGVPSCQVRTGMLILIYHIETGLSLLRHHLIYCGRNIHLSCLRLLTKIFGIISPPHTHHLACFIHRSGETMVRKTQRSHRLHKQLNPSNIWQTSAQISFLLPFVRGA